MARLGAAWWFLAVLGACAVGGATAQDELCFNQLQVLGSHNSYHQAPPQEMLQAFGGVGAGPLAAWQYTQPPLTEQLERGVRAFELDAYWDPQGGTYAQAAGLKIANRSGWLADERYKQPGFKVLHVPDFDFRTSCILLSECLAELRAWSDANPRHLPIRVYMEVKPAGQLREAVGDVAVRLLEGLLRTSTADGPTSFVQQPETTAQTFRDLNGELEAAFGPGGGGKLVTPDEMRQALGAADGAALAAALRQAPPGSGPCPWPSLEQLRGRMLVVLVLGGGSPEAAALQEAFPDLRGSLAWVEQAGRRELAGAVFRSTATSRISAGQLSLDLPPNATDIVARLAQGIRDAAAAGFLVRARADADTVEARAGFTGRRDACFAAGAQVVASDFVAPAAQQLAAEDGGGAGAAPKAVPLYPPGSLYRVALPGGREGRCLRDSSTGGGGSSSGGGSGAQTVPVSLQAVLEEPSGGDAIFCGSLEAALAALDAADAASSSNNSTASTSGGGVLTDGSSASADGSSQAAAGSAPGAPPQQEALQPEPAVMRMSAGGRLRPLATLAAALLAGAAAAVL